jgi:hypothetical protein
MPGTYAEQATLATDNGFISKCRAALISKAVAVTNSNQPQKIAKLQQMQSILQSAGGNAPSMAWLVACGNVAIAAAAPAVPSDADTQTAVNALLADTL